MARRYEQGDISGGYVASQIAHFRRGITKDRYESIIDKFRLVESEIQQRHLKLPSAFIDFIYDYEKVVRIRHNTICLQIPDRLVAFPGSENLWLFLMFAGAQGSGFWYLLLSENADPIVVWCSDAIGMDEDRPASMHAYPTTLTFRKCADSFEAWIVMYFIQSAAHDRNYEAALKQFPGL